MVAVISGENAVTRSHEAAQIEVNVCVYERVCSCVCVVFKAPACAMMALIKIF